MCSSTFRHFCMKFCLLVVSLVLASTTQATPPP